jgi:uncharacterized oxidoreductase
MAESHLFAADPLTRAIEGIVAAGGSSAAEARIVAENLVTANLLGHDSHGIGMIPRYVDSLLEGGLVPNQSPTVKLDSGSMLALDGNRGYGQSIGRQAMAMAIERAKQHGTCIMGLGRSHHLARIGQWAEQATAAGLVSIHFTNVISRAIVAPFGGGDARFGTNPVTIGIPLPGEPPMILDFATARVAQGKMRVAYNKGVKVPADHLIDDAGRPTDDPKFAVVPPFGAIRTFGEHKGFGLAVVCELLGGALTGGGTWHEEYKGNKQVLNGMLSIVFDPARLGTGDAFAAEARAFLDWVRSGPAEQGVDKVRIAGEPEREWSARRRVEGLPVDATTWADILAAGEKVKVPRATTQARAEGRAV